MDSTWLCVSRLCLHNMEEVISSNQHNLKIVYKFVPISSSPSPYLENEKQILKSFCD